MDDTPTLTVESRNVKNEPNSRALRRSGLMPAVIYGQGRSPLHLKVNMKNFNNLLNYVTSQSLIHMTVEGEESASKTVMIKDLQRHPVTRKFIHADFYEVDMAKEIHINIPVDMVGEAPGVEEGGILQIIRRELEVVCLPGNIPETIEIDVSHLNIGDSVHVSEISLGENVQLMWDPEEESDYTVIAVAAPTIEEEPTEEELEEGEEGAEAEEGEAPENEADDTE